MSKRRFLRSLRPGQVRADATEDIRQEIELYLELRAAEFEREGDGPRRGAATSRTALRGHDEDRG